MASEGSWRQVREALLSLRQLAFVYLGGSTPGRRREVTPLGLLFGRSNYLLAAEGEAGAPRQSRGLNALSLSEITGIPRESARRKLLLLAANGYLHRDADGLFTLADRYGLETFFAELKPLFADAVAPRA